MKLMMKSIIGLLLLMSTGIQLWAQKPATAVGLPVVNMKMGKPTMEEMTMESCPFDAEADAVVLMQTCDVRYVMATMYDLSVVYDYKMRIKILTDEGKKYGDFTIPFYSNAEDLQIEEEEFSEFSAASYNLNEKGKIVSTKLTQQHIRDERVDNRHKVRKFSVPQVQKGSIVEVRYQLRSQRFFFIYDYDMQRDIPVAYEKCFMEIPAVLQFNVEAPVKRQNVSTNVSGSYIQIENSDPKRPQRCNANCYTIEAAQMPALKDVNYVWNVDDYAAKVVCDLKTMQFPQTAKRNYGMTWEQADRLILDQDQIGAKLNDKSKFREELAASGISAIADEKERIGAAVLFLASRVAWNGKYNNLPDYANAIVKKKSGSSADVNLMLINVLNDLGFTSYPVYLSTRRHGRLPIHPSANAFNTFVVAVETTNGLVYVDGTDPYGAVNVLNPNLYVAQARKIGMKVSGSWVDLTKLAQHKTAYLSSISLSADGTMTGELSAKYSKNSARELKADYHNAKDSVAYVQSLQEKYGITISSMQLTGQNQYGDEVKNTVKFQKAAEATDDHIYVSPFVFNPMGESPFKDETRELPVEMPYPVSLSYFVDVNIPDGYAVEETPKDFEVTVPDRSLTVKMTCKNAADKVSITYSFVSKKMYHEAEAYTAIKKVYDMACQSMGDMIVLKKKL